ncbi:MAG: Cna B-type domain-containing protein, partial [Lachnospiraceae bacterium]|nr:Cna B-type domain-containing protein [Lachnospiraceae bacterium]
VASQEVTPDANGNWSWSFTGLPKYENGQEIQYTITEDAVAGYTSEVTGYNVTNSYTPETTEVSGSKTWNDAENQDGKRPESITIRVWNGATEVASQEVTPDANGNWSWSFTGLPKYENGQEIQYTITEDAVAGYTSEVTGYNVTNSYTPETTEVSGSKTWNDAENQDGKRPESITIRVWNGATEVASQEVTPDANGNWSWSFTGLPKYENGQEIQYTITEDAVAGYTSEVTGYNVTNSYTPETTEVSGSKTWNDNNNQDGKRPESITIRVWNGATEVASQEVTPDENGNWSWSFTDLPKYENGQEITYTVTEDAVEGYESEVTGYNVTNSYTPETTEVSGSKTWNDAENQDGKRPESITIRVWNGATEVASQEVRADADGNWSWSFTDLPKYEAGEEILYTITEDEVEEYEAAVNGYDVVNTHIPETVEVSGTKTWKDNGQSGKRPESITIRLWRGSEELDSQTVTAENDWSWSFTDLPKYEAGEEIEYTITEDPVEGYLSEVDGYDVTNTITSVSISKVDIATYVELSGAHIQILDAAGNVVEEWDSVEEAHEVTGLRTGVIYTLRETVAPDGYTITTDTTFALNEDGTINTESTTTATQDGILLVEDARSIEVSKVDGVTGESLGGAHIQVLDAQGNVMDEWDSEAGANHVVRNLRVNEAYTLRETSAPEGYEVTTDTTFTIDREGNVTGTVAFDENGVVLIEDQRTQSEDTSVTVVKTVSYNGFALFAEDISFWAALYYDEACTQIAEQPQELRFENAASSQVTFNNLEIGRTYYVGECDADGNVIYSGEVTSGVTYQARFTGTNGNMVVTREGTDTMVSLDNQLDGWPDGFYAEGTLHVTKQLLGEDGAPEDSDEVFYAGIFTDASYTTLFDGAANNILTLDLNGGSEASAETQIVLPSLESVVTLYVTEVDANGTPVAGAAGFAYEVSVDQTSVTLDVEHSEATVVITNTIVPEDESEEESETESETDTETETTSPRTGDSTPVMPLVSTLAVSGMAVLLLLVYRRRREDEC